MDDPAIRGIIEISRLFILNILHGNDSFTPRTVPPVYCKHNLDRSFRI